MKTNVLKFKNNIKKQVDLQKGLISLNELKPIWMHPAYCAYYILKHNVENVDKYIDEDIKRSYKALPDYCSKESFKKIVKKHLENYAEVVCADKQ